MNFYIVMQGRTYIEEKANGLIWSLQQDKTGQPHHFWERMKEVTEGDAIFHYVRGEIMAVSIVQQGYSQVQNPYTAESTVGYLVKTNYEELAHPLNIKQFWHELQPFMPIKYAAFQDNGDGNQGYLYPCNELLALKLLELLSDSNIYEEEQEQLEFAIGPIATKERNTLAPILIETEANAKVKIRKGQQKFKSALAPLWQHKCALCNIELPALLRASHAKPWKDSTDDERLNPYNGLLLCCNHDALYDAGYIAFDGTGKIHISSDIEEADYEKYGIHLKMKVARQEENKPFFKWHKREVFKGN